MDIPAPGDIAALATFRGEGRVSIYLRTTPVTPQAQGGPIELKNLAKRAAEQLQAAGTDKRNSAAIAEQLDDLVDDNEFWRFQAHSLAIFVTPQNLRPVVTGSGVPLVLAAAEPLASTYRSVKSYPHLAAATIEGNPEAMTEAQLGERARAVLDGIHRDELTARRTLFEARANQGRATTDIAQAARAATVGAVDSMLMDIDETLPGRIANDGP